MKVVNRFVLGKLALEEALLGGVPNEGHIRILLTLGNGHIMMRVQERECTPLFTRIPIGVAALKGKRPAMLQCINNGLKKIKEDGSYEMILMKWMWQTP